MKYRKVFNRRTLLKGAGSIAIALPFLDEMRVRSVFGATPEPPVRSITVFWGEGLPNHAQTAYLPDLSGPLAPLQPHKDKLGFVRGLGYLEGFGAHEAGGMCPFTGVNFVSLNQAGGPSVDQVMLQELYPNGLPPGVIPTLAMGFYGSYRTSGDFFRRVKSWKNDGSPSEIPKAYPSELFTRIFGSAQELDESELRAERSVLDSVTAQYQHLTSDASNLSLASRSRLKDHLDRVREYEQRIFGELNCLAPEAPADPPLYNGQESFNGVDLTVDDITAHWRLNVDLFVLALQCDVARVGMAHLLNVGDRIDLKGDYLYNGQLIYNFDDSRDRPTGVPDSEAVNHEHFHDWDNPGNVVAEHHLHFYMRELAYLFERLSDPAFTDDNGGTLIDNAMLLVTTELSQPGAHSVTGVLHMIGAANDRFKTGGQIINAGNGTRPAVDLYNTVLRAYGVDNRTMGTELFTGTVDAVVL